MESTSWRERLLSEGWFIRLRKADYESYIERPAPAVYRPRRFVFLYLEAEERVPNFVHTFGALAPGADSGIVEIENIYTAKKEMLHQLFFGCRTQCRIYLEYPLGKKAMILEKRMWDVKTAPDVSYLDESKSPFHEPNPGAEVFLVPGLKIGWLVYNPTDAKLTSQINFMGKRFIHSTVIDENMIDRLERRVIPYRPVSFGAIA